MIEISDEVYEYLRESGMTGDTFTDVILELIKKAGNKAEFDKKIQEQSKATNNYKSVEELEEELKDLELRKEQLKLLHPHSMTVEPLSDNIQHLESIMQITNRNLLRRHPNGTRIRFRFRGQNYETQINNLMYKYPTLNFIFTNEFKVSVDIWRLDIYFKDEKGWQPLTILRE
ncbi:MAG: hypothetical protein O8C61_11705 [Candidatus Methanoperedens sp.]|nr:hypothetical protein [Candidatus Methanoperedens sp.]